MAMAGSSRASAAVSGTLNPGARLVAKVTQPWPPFISAIGMQR